MDFHRGWRKRADELSETSKLLVMLGTHISPRLRFYGKAVIVTRRLTLPMTRHSRNLTCC
jgi:amidase